MLFFVDLVSQVVLWANSSGYGCRSPIWLWCCVHCKFALGRICSWLNQKAGFLSAGAWAKICWGGGGDVSNNTVL